MKGCLDDRTGRGFARPPHVLPRPRTSSPVLARLSHDLRAKFIPFTREDKHAFFQCNALLISVGNSTPTHPYP